ALDRLIADPHERSLMSLLTAPLRVGLPVVAPPGLPADLTAQLRQSYFNMVSSQPYRNEATRLGFDVGRPNLGSELDDFVSHDLATVSPEVIHEYRSYVEHQ